MLICNLQGLNQTIAYHHLKMNSLQTANQIMTKSFNMASMHIIEFQLRKNIRKILSFNAVLSYMNIHVLWAMYEPQNIH